MSVSKMRTPYRRGRLDVGDVGSDPLATLTAWIDAAAEAGMIEPNAMALATADRDGRPSSRMVLCKGIDARGATFYTSFESRKGRELDVRPWAAATFWWDRLERQIRLEGPVDRVADEEADAYFASRPRGSRIGAWASRQSSVLGDRAALERAAAEAEAHFYGLEEIPRPPGWGGFRLAPLGVEFWQGREDRLHDRLRFERTGLGAEWTVERLAP